MQQKIVFAFLLFCLGICSSTYAQSTADLGRSFMPAEDTELKEIKDENWSLYADEENRIYYIDFEKLTFNLSDIIVKNDDGEVIFKEDVFDLPVNTIYELDYADFKSGEYQLELRSFTGIIRKTISIK